MAAARPEILVIAGVNGAGKSSVAGARMPNAGGQFCNLDLHARELQLERAIGTGLNFALETTLGGTTIPKLLRGAAASHDIHVLFVGLDSPERHIARVAARVRAGGHDIHDARIRARFTSSRANLIGLVPVLASLRRYDNSIEVASGGTSIPLPVRLLEMEHGVITYEAPRGSIPGWAKAIVQAARDHAR